MPRTYNIAMSRGGGRWSYKIDYSYSCTFKAFSYVLLFFCAFPLTQALHGGTHFNDREQQVKLWNSGRKTSSSWEQVEEMIFCCVSNLLSHNLNPQDDSLQAHWSHQLQAVNPHWPCSGGTVLLSNRLSGMPKFVCLKIADLLQFFLLYSHYMLDIKI